jgi:hypothetical protein
MEFFIDINPSDRTMALGSTIVRQSGSEQSLTENKTSLTLFVLYYQPP